MADVLALSTPTHISSVVFNNTSILAAGSVDGIIRLYKLPEKSVYKAIRGLPDEISCIVFSSKDGNEVWAASKREAVSFQIDCDKLILNHEDARDSIEIGLDDNDVLNEIALNSNNTFLAFSSDSGAVGVVDLSSKSISRMRTSHQSICGTVSFIPDRPNEIISGGYDCALLHYDFKQGSVLSRYDIASPTISTGVTLSPPFILATCLSHNGIIAIGTADGQIWIGFGGVKDFAGTGKVKAKRSRKWGGLDSAQSFVQKTEEGPIVGLAFVAPDCLISCTLLGKLMMHKFNMIPYTSQEDNAFSPNINKVSNDDPQKQILRPIRQLQTLNISKVNAIAFDAKNKCLAIAGIDKDKNKGVVETIYKIGMEEEEKQLDNRRVST